MVKIKFSTSITSSTILLTLYITALFCLHFRCSSSFLSLSLIFPFLFPVFGADSIFRHFVNITIQFIIKLYIHSRVTNSEENVFPATFLALASNQRNHLHSHNGSI